MTGTGADDALIRELRACLIGTGLTDGVNLVLRADNDMVQVHLMAIHLGKLGDWQYRLIAGRYQHSSDIVFSAQIRLPASDLTAVLSRLRLQRRDKKTTGPQHPRDPMSNTESILNPAGLVGLPYLEGSSPCRSSTQGNSESGRCGWSAGTPNIACGMCRRFSSAITPGLSVGCIAMEAT